MCSLPQLGVTFHVAMPCSGPHATSMGSSLLVRLSHQVQTIICPVAVTQMQTCDGYPQQWWQQWQCHVGAHGMHAGLTQYHLQQPAASGAAFAHIPAIHTNYTTTVLPVWPVCQRLMWYGDGLLVLPQSVHTACPSTRTASKSVLPPTSGETTIHTAPLNSQQAAVNDVPAHHPPAVSCGGTMGWWLAEGPVLPDG